jgi:hypothetical protein
MEDEYDNVVVFTDGLDTIWTAEDVMFLPPTDEEADEEDSFDDVDNEEDDDDDDDDDDDYVPSGSLDDEDFDIFDDDNAVEMSGDESTPELSN